MQQSLLLFFLCGVLISISISSFPLFYAYLLNWADKIRRKHGATKEQWIKTSTLPDAPNRRIAVYRFLIVLFGISIGFVVLFGPGFVFIYLFHKLYEKASDLVGTEMPAWKIFVALVFGVALCRFTIGRLIDSIVKDINSSIAADDAPPNPQDENDPSK